MKIKKISYLFAFSLAIMLLPALANTSGSSASAACVYTAATATASATCTGTPDNANSTACPSRSVLSAAACTTDSQNLVTVVGNTTNANDNAFVTTLCNVFKIATGNGGKAFAAFAIISLGIGFFTGKVSWGLMLGVAAGIAAMFGAPTIVAAIAGGEAFKC